MITVTAEDTPIDVAPVSPSLDVLETYATHQKLYDQITSFLDAAGVSKPYTLGRIGNEGLSLFKDAGGYWIVAES